MALRALLVAFALLCTSCAGSRVLTLERTTRAFTAEDYDAIYRAWTRHAEDFSFRTLESVLHATATFESWEFRWAYIVRYAQDFGLEPERRESLLQNSLAEAERQHRFFITMAGRNWRESDLSNDRSVWRVILLDDTGRQVSPVRIERIARPGGRDRAFFPSISPFRQTFRVSFPAVHSDGMPILRPTAHKVTLRFTGPQGRIDLDWDLSAPEQMPPVTGG